MVLIVEGTLPARATAGAGPSGPSGPSVPRCHAAVAAALLAAWLPQLASGFSLRAVQGGLVQGGLAQAPASLGPSPAPGPAPVPAPLAAAPPAVAAQEAPRGTKFAPEPYDPGQGGFGGAHVDIHQTRYFLPPDSVRRIVSVECLEDHIADPHHKCPEEDYVRPAAPAPAPALAPDAAASPAAVPAPRPRPSKHKLHDAGSRASRKAKPSLADAQVAAQRAAEEEMSKLRG
eukprot:CAMPEP_0170631564 /NCGR_PEP_ID=MMETSP0224-20130122/34721_1 /TAXON_ID=285029 /ORGANISM="Togula jolla, Strain CCCM 725" /LENGTH=230 /DNA_ID=CAMNT_0010959937 /DNA_START=60 /DNA_END=753 /DNA_ORIENTATION=-